ncbi:sensor histidine kinase [Homoserinibacter sp. YIM 151385]|uniref:sensor histidine kinase n=1 Tax=Homoserinibacter sp. YIM 151385 TaxID=2985506 RepID=UPI0022F08496|nr:ATP-binding protein [Homoserinibacter sp. YIM 151385]WBU37805.1 ATP-binding protein [Homoserinibacter sp. YIM 151385]
MLRRMMRLARSARVRILAAILAVAALGLAVAGTATWLGQRERVLADIDVRLAAAAEGLQSIADGRQDEEPPASVEAFLERAMQRVLPARNESTIGLVDGEPSLVPSSGIRFRLDEDPDFIARVVAETEGSGQVVRGTAATAMGTLRYAAIPVEIGSDEARGLYVTAYDLDAELGEITQSFQLYSIYATGALVIIALVGWFVAGRLLRPTRRLQATAARISDTDLTERIEVDGSDDLSELARTVNAMLDRLEASFRAQRRLLDDVGHELRTPLTIVRGHLELLERQPGRDLDATRRLALDEVDRMSELVQDIALIARSSDPDFLRREPVDLDAFAAEVAEKAAALSDRHRWTSGSSVPGAALLDRRRITQAWLQLAENAAKYSPDGTRIHLEAVPVGGALRLSVADEGPGIPEAALERVFERFARVDEGRGAEGSGLGLSIVQAIAVAHGGHASAERRPGGGTRVLITVPRVSPEEAATGRRKEDRDAAHPAR